MNILILGGSGILSTDFTKLTLDKQNKVWIVNRGKRKSQIDSRASLIVADLRNESIEELREKIAVNQYDVVIDFLSFNPDQLKKTLAVIQGCFTQYVFISSATVYDKKNEDVIITEETKVGNPNWEYALEKYHCEQYLKDLDINYTIIRPYVTYGDTRIPFPIISYDKHFTLIERIRNEKPVVLLNDGEALCTLTHTVDFANILYMLLNNPQSYKEAYHITSSQVQSWKEVYLILCDILQVEPNYASVSFDDIDKYLPEFSEILKGDKGTNMRFDNSKVMNVIGEYDFKVSLQEGLRSTVEYYLKTQEMQAVDYKWDGRIDYLVKRTQSKKPKNLAIMKQPDISKKDKLSYYAMCYEPWRSAIDAIKKIRDIRRRRSK